MLNGPGLKNKPGEVLWRKKKKEQKKDPFEEILEIMEKYEEGTEKRTDLSDWGE